MKYCFTLALVLILVISLHGVDLKRTQRSRKRATCSYKNHVNGCSIPGNLPFFFKETFTPACDEHDVCYFCGERYGMSRKECDKVFLVEMKSICSTLQRKRWFTTARSRCESFADVYFSSVYWFGEDFFEKKSPAWCEDACVKQFLSKNFNPSA